MRTRPTSLILQFSVRERKGVLSLITPRIATVVAASADVNSDCGDVICENAETYMSPVPRSKKKIAEFVKELQGRIRIINLERKKKHCS